MTEKTTALEQATIFYSRPLGQECFKIQSVWIQKDNKVHIACRTQDAQLCLGQTLLNQQNNILQQNAYIPTEWNK